MAHAIITRLMRVSKVVFFSICCASSASAWDRVGHLVVDAIAWEHMSEPTRARAVEILRSAPRDAGLALSGLGPREFFVRSGYWPDVVRDEAWPVRKAKYDHPTWHYVNHFWREDGTSLPEMGLNGELLERLEVLAGAIPDAVELAWLLHLVGDVHQPLHSSARVTNAEPHGDRGGNDFALDDPESSGNLHAFWDSIQMRARRKRHGEGYPAWIDRIAGEISTLHSRATLASEISVQGFTDWSKAGAKLARTRLYPSYLVRDARPPKSHRSRPATFSRRASWGRAGFPSALTARPRFPWTPPRRESFGFSCLWRRGLFRRL